MLFDYTDIVFQAITVSYIVFLSSRAQTRREDEHTGVPPEGQVCVHRHCPAPNPPGTVSISPSERHNPPLPLHNLLRTRCAALSDLRRAQHRLFAGRRCSAADQVTSGLERPRSGFRTIPMRFPVERKRGRTQTSNASICANPLAHQRRARSNATCRSYVGRLRVSRILPTPHSRTCSPMIGSPSPSIGTFVAGRSSASGLPRHLAV